MSLVSSRISLSHVCTIERDANAASTSSDGWGSSPSWQAHLSNLACRFWAVSGREQIADKDSIVGVDEQKMIVPLGSDITERDRISAAGVTYRGAAIITGPIGIRAVNPRKDHLELILTRVV